MSIFSRIGSALASGTPPQRTKTPPFLPAPTALAQDPYALDQTDDMPAIVGPSTPGGAVASGRTALPKYQEAVERHQQLLENAPQEPKVGLGRKVAGLLIQGASPFAGPGVLAAQYLGQRVAMGDYPERMQRYKAEVSRSAEALKAQKDAETDERLREDHAATLKEKEASRLASEASKSATERNTREAAEEKKFNRRITMRQAGAEPYTPPKPLEVPSTLPGMPPTTVDTSQIPTPDNVEKDPEGKLWTIPPKGPQGTVPVPVKEAEELGLDGPAGEYNGQPVKFIPATSLAQARKPPKADAENPNQWIADSTNPDPAISVPAKRKLAEHERMVKAGRATNQIFTPGEVRNNLDEIAQGLANGDLIQIQRVTSLRSGERSYVMAKARQLNPTFTPAEVDRKVKAVDYWTNGKGADSLQSFDTFLQHAAEAESAAGQVWNTNKALFNKPLSWWKQNMSADPAFAQFMTALEPVGKEFESFLLNGRALYTEDRASINKLLNENQPFSVTVATLKQMSKTAKDRYTSMNQRHKNVVGSDLPTPWSPAALDAAKRMGIDIGGGPGVAPVGGGGSNPALKSLSTEELLRKLQNGGR